MPNSAEMKPAYAMASPFATHLALPLRIPYTALIRCSVRHAITNERRNLMASQGASSPRDGPVPLHYSGTCSDAAERGAGLLVLSTLRPPPDTRGSCPRWSPEGRDCQEHSNPSDEALGSRSVPFGGEQELDRLPVRIHGAIHIRVLAVHLYIRLVVAVAFVVAFRCGRQRFFSSGPRPGPAARCNWGPLPRRGPPKARLTCS
jgi:hypothetical protein